MEKSEYFALGAYCLSRMSLNTQKELLALAENGQSFSGVVLSGLNEIDKGYDFVKACSGRLDLPGFMDILAHCDPATIDRIITGAALKAAFLNSGELKGHYVLANEAVYYTQDMESAVQWFAKTLGWSGVIEAKDEAGNGVYGLIMPHLNPNLPGCGSSPYFQLMRGQPLKRVVAMVQVWGLENLRRRIVDSGWTPVTPVSPTPWGANTFDLTTLDDSLITFYEPAGLP